MYYNRILIRAYNNLGECNGISSAETAMMTSYNGIQRYLLLADGLIGYFLNLAGVIPRRRGDHAADGSTNVKLFSAINYRCRADVCQEISGIVDQDTAETKQCFGVGADDLNLWYFRGKIGSGGQLFPSGDDVVPKGGNLIINSTRYDYEQYGCCGYDFLGQPGVSTNEQHYEYHRILVSAFDGKKYRPRSGIWCSVYCYLTTVNLESGSSRSQCRAPRAGESDNGLGYNGRCSVTELCAGHGCGINDDGGIGSNYGHDMTCQSFCNVARGSYGPSIGDANDDFGIEGVDTQGMHQLSGPKEINHCCEDVSGIGMRYAAAEADERLHTIQVQCAEGYDLLSLRGGGPRTRESTLGQARARKGLPQDCPPGAGVLRWLEDDSGDFEDSEKAEWARRQSEIDILRRPNGDGPRHPLITGEWHGQKVVICGRCCRSVAHDRHSWSRCACGMVSCAACTGPCPCGQEVAMVHTPFVEESVQLPRLVEEATPQRGPDVTEGVERRGVEQGGVSRLIRLWEALGSPQASGEQRRPQASAWPPAGSTPSSDAEYEYGEPECHQEEGDEGRGPSGHSQHLAADCYAMDVDDGGDSAPEDQGQRERIACLRCGIGQQAGLQWRICRCLAVYCAECGRHPCLDCPDLGVNGARQISLFKELRDHLMVSEFCKAADDAQPIVPSPTRVTPEKAHEKRMTERGIKQTALAAKREQGRLIRRRQERAGTRPPRRRRKEAGTSYVTANVNCAARAKQEYEHGSAFTQGDVVFLQEHKLKGEDTTRLEKWCSDRGYDAVVDVAYIKEVSEGGGTAAVGRGIGIRRLTTHADIEFQGRLTMVVTEQQRDVLGGSLYGISGQPPAAQIPLWRHMAARLICAGLPFVVSGDWQVEPGVLKASGLPSLLDATVVHPGCPTNTHTHWQRD